MNRSPKSPQHSKVAYTFPVHPRREGQLLSNEVTSVEEKSGPADARYSIRLASKMSGISPHTLRMWERRYGYPVPQRTEGGARRYTEQDVATLRLVAQALETGYRAGDVVGQPMGELRMLIAEQTPSMSPDAILPELGAIAAAVRRDEEATVREQLEQAAAALGPKRFLMEVAHPLAVELGELWAKDELKIRQEHLATDMLATQIRTLIAKEQRPRKPPRIVLTTLPDERHGLSLDMIALYLATQDATPLSLGASTPVHEIAGAAMALKADVVGLSVSAAADIAAVQSDARALLDELPRRVELWVGGEGAAKLALEELGATHAGSWAAVDGALKTWRQKN